MRIGLVACGKAKRDRAARASELYTSPLFPVRSRCLSSALGRAGPVEAIGRSRIYWARTLRPCVAWRAWRAPDLLESRAMARTARRVRSV